MKKKDKTKQTESQVKKSSASCCQKTCVCNMEWRGSRGNEESDCICYPETGEK